MLLAAGIGAVVIAAGAALALSRPATKQLPPPPTEPSAPSGGGIVAPEPGGVNVGGVVGGLTTAVGAVAAVGKVVGGLVGGGGATTGAVAGASGGASAGVSAGGGASSTALSTVATTGTVTASSVGAVAAPVLIVAAVTAIVVAGTMLQQAALNWAAQTLAVRKRYRRALFHEENTNNELVLTRLGKSFERENVAFAAYDNNTINEYAVRVKTTAASLAGAAVGMPTGSAALQRLSQNRTVEQRAAASIAASDWGLITALHRFLALERVSAFNDAILNYYKFRGHDVTVGGGLALERLELAAFANEWCNDEPYAAELGYRCGYSYQALLDIAQANPALLDSARWARLQGTAKAIALAAKSGFQDVVNPGDVAYTMKVQQACGLSDWVYLGKAQLKHPSLPVAVDVVKSREAGGAILYDLRDASQVPPDQLSAWSLSQAKRAAA